jgi:hypothetical protein
MDPDSFNFIIDFQDANKKLICKKSFPAYYFCKVLLHHFSKITDKASKRSHKTVKSRFFLLFLLNDTRIRIQEAQKHVNPVDPDPDTGMHRKRGNVPGPAVPGARVNGEYERGCRGKFLSEEKSQQQ